jgi:hypothetical protein
MVGDGNGRNGGNSGNGRNGGNGRSGENGISGGNGGNNKDYVNSNSKLSDQKKLDIIQLDFKKKYLKYKMKYIQLSGSVENEDYSYPVNFKPDESTELNLTEIYKKGFIDKIIIKHIFNLCKQNNINIYNSNIESIIQLYYKKINDLYIDGMALNNATPFMKNNKNIVVIALHNNGLALQYASRDIKIRLAESAVTKNGCCLKFIPLPLPLWEIPLLLFRFGFKFNEYNIVEMAVKQNGLALRFASDDLKNDKNIVTTAVTNNGMALLYASENLRNDRDVVDTAVTKNALALQYASKKFIKNRDNTDVIKKALINNGMALKFIDNIVTKDRFDHTYYGNLEQIAFENTPLSLEYASYAIHNQENVKKAIAKDGMFLKNASPELKDNYYVVMGAVALNGLALEYSSVAWKGNHTNGVDVVKNAVNQNGMALQFATENLKKDENVVKNAVNQNGMALQFAIENLKKEKNVVIEAVKKTGMALQFASDNLREDEDVVIEAVKQNGMALQFTTNNLKKKKNVVIEAVKKTGIALQFASDNLREDEDVVILAVIQDINALQFASKIVLTDINGVTKAVTNNGLALQYASDKVRGNVDVVTKAVTNNGLALQYASDEVRENVDVVMNAINNKVMALKYVSENMRNKDNIFNCVLESEEIKSSFNHSQMYVLFEDDNIKLTELNKIIVTGNKF